MKTYAYINPNESQGMSCQLNKMMSYNCDEFFIEEKEAKGNRELECLLKVVRKGDCVVIADINVFGMNLKKLNELMTNFFSWGVCLISVDDQLESTEMLPFEKALSLFAKIETRQTVYNTQRRRLKAIESGKEWGRPMISADKIREIRFLHENNNLTMREIALECDVSLGTVHKYLTKITTSLD